MGEGELAGCWRITPGPARPTRETRHQVGQVGPTYCWRVLEVLRTPEAKRPAGTHIVAIERISTIFRKNLLTRLVHACIISCRMVPPVETDSR